MKIAILLFGILTSTCTWWWVTRRQRPDTPLAFPQKLQVLAKSVMAGVIVYFGLLLILLLYLAITSR